MNDIKLLATELLEKCIDQKVEYRFCNRYASGRANSLEIHILKEEDDDGYAEVLAEVTVGKDFDDIPYLKVGDRHFYELVTKLTEAEEVNLKYLLNKISVTARKKFLENLEGL